MPSTPSPIVVLVPVKLDAFGFNPAVCNGKSDEAKIAPITQPNYTFLRVDEFVAQHDVLPHVDLHLSSPSSTNLRLMDLGTGEMRPRTGVYLHWSLPRAYRRGITPRERCCPGSVQAHTRCLVIRRLYNEGQVPPGTSIPEIQAWVVKSDKPNDIGNLGANRPEDGRGRGSVAVYAHGHEAKRSILPGRQKCLSAERDRPMSGKKKMRQAIEHS